VKERSKKRNKRNGRNRKGKNAKKLRGKEIMKRGKVRIK
jgi:hypothetical protein